MHFSNLLFTPWLEAGEHCRCPDRAALCRLTWLWSSSGICSSHQSALPWGHVPYSLPSRLVRPTQLIFRYPEVVKGETLPLSRGANPCRRGSCNQDSESPTEEKEATSVWPVREFTSWPRVDLESGNGCPRETRPDPVPRQRAYPPGAFLLPPTEAFWTLLEFMLHETFTKVHSALG